jgi:hypothetical protein
MARKDQSWISKSEVSSPAGCVCHDPDVRVLDRWTLSLAHHNYTHSMITILTDVSCTYQESSPSRAGSVGRDPTLNPDLRTR